MAFWLTRARSVARVTVLPNGIIVKESSPVKSTILKGLSLAAFCLLMATARQAQAQQKQQPLSPEE